MQHINEYEHDQSVIYHNRNQVIDRCDQWAGSNCRINFDLVEKHWDQSADHTGNYHGYHQGKSNAAGNYKGMCYRITF